MEPEPIPITGRETTRDGPASRSALDHFYAAFNGKDLVLMSENWEQSDDIAMDNPLGGIKRGWSEIKQGYQRIFSGHVQVYVEFYDYTIHETDNVFYAVGRERGTCKYGNLVIDLAIRTSRIYRRIGDRWKQVHHHGSIDNPNLLRRYQDLVNQANMAPVR